ncbi:Retrovirus-related Pol polyprotein from transposon RE1 [Bienertia sinuspersici]
MAGTACCFLNCLNSKWLLDSGATDHVCSSLDFFVDFHPVHRLHNTITIPDGRKVEVKHKGLVKLNNQVVLQDVLHVPEFKYNLISVHKLCKDLGCAVYFTDKHCYLQGLSQKELIMPLGDVQEGLYTVGADSSSQGFSKNNSVLSHVSSSASLVDKAKLWHLRLGHVPFNKIHLVLPDCNVGNAMHDVFCKVCPKAKQTRLPFSPSTSQSNRPFALLHVDLWGPYKHKTYTGCNQFVTLVDDYSRFTWVHLLKFKSDVVQILDNFFTYVETQFGTKVGCVRSDNAQELTEGKMKLIYAQRGIIHQTSCSETSEQNGVWNVSIDIFWKQQGVFFSFICSREILG